MPAHARARDVMRRRAAAQSRTAVSAALAAIA
jgi:hypothetical protein